MKDNESYVPMLFPGEQEAVERALEAGRRFGYGNLIAHLKKAWIESLMRQGLGQDAATMITEDRSPYPVEPPKTAPTVDMVFWPEKHKRTLKVHLEPAEFAKCPAEDCVVCRKPTRTWLTPHIPLCACCAAEGKNVPRGT